MSVPAESAEQAFANAQELVEQLELEGRRLLARLVEFGEDVWAEAKAVRDGESGT